METADNVGSTQLEAGQLDYLSIGEVLAQLQQEFTEVTISKIRFLEGQGLIHLDRTASGYRRFYPADVARLRWILRQQRDHFLPLKVIKARLEEISDIDFEAAIAVQPNLWAGTDDDPNRLIREAEAAAEAAAAADAFDTNSVENATAQVDLAEAGAPAPKPAASPPMSQRNRKKRRRAPMVINDSIPAEAAPAPSTEASTDSSGTSSGTEAIAEPPAESAGDGQPAHDPAAWLAALQEPPTAQGSGRATRQQPEPAPAPLPLTRGLRFGRSEVLEVAGIDDADLATMEEYGLVVPAIIGGEPTYDGSSLAVVKSMKRFLAHGVEPRHLRMFKNAADREAGFYEQMVLPLLKQRNPRAAEQAASLLAEMSDAGDELRRALVQQALRKHFND